VNLSDEMVERVILRHQGQSEGYGPGESLFLFDKAFGKGA